MSNAQLGRAGQRREPTMRGNERPRALPSFRYAEHNIHRHDNEEAA